MTSLIATQQIVKEQERLNYPNFHTVRPAWQVDYDVYGGLKAYLTIRNLYWYISSLFIEEEGSYNATNFPLIGYEESITQLLKQFRTDLSKPIKWYETN
jgi:hypothetical protein